LRHPTQASTVLIDHRQLPLRQLRGGQMNISITGRMCPEGLGQRRCANPSSVSV
jgi:hypothetical protein